MPTEQMAKQMSQQISLTDWLSKVSAAKTRQEVFAILDRFREHTWTDEERSRMSKHYIRHIENLPDGDTGTTDESVKTVEQGQTDDSKAGEKDGDDGPVWYEKM